MTKLFVIDEVGYAWNEFEVDDRIMEGRTPEQIATRADTELAIQVDQEPGNIIGAKKIGDNVVGFGRFGQDKAFIIIVGPSAESLKVEPEKLVETDTDQWLSLWE